ncbi:U3 small nucleolar RNA-associated protein 25 homolog isoform X2 [Corticium candelabrum]|uniref:U3 small nucleolar RNA-associated protein 25 homolog isoform X2 n=1 Tax=Corticium candelabrum TaxID=121492 RepID=UPI002E263F87|nr:U3 small nucleolar RNA-associated protein 25 homolog isoform X2 [Corticium candelabrum]
MSSFSQRNKTKGFQSDKRKNPRKRIAKFTGGRISLDVPAPKQPRCQTSTACSKTSLMSEARDRVMEDSLLNDADAYQLLIGSVQDAFATTAEKAESWHGNDKVFDIQEVIESNSHSGSHLEDINATKKRADRVSWSNQQFSEKSSSVAINTFKELSSDDSFCKHFEHELSEEGIKQLEILYTKGTEWQAVSTNVLTGVENISGIVHPVVISSNLAASCHQKTITNSSDFEVHKSAPTEFKLVARLAGRWSLLNSPSGGDTQCHGFTMWQAEIFEMLNGYQDVLYAQENQDNADELRRLYCLHSLNHVLKSQYRILRNNAKYVKAQQEGVDPKEICSECCDQGFTRPKVLVVLPFRNTALKVIQTMIKLLMPEEEKYVGHKKRFQEEYGCYEEDEASIYKPESYRNIFRGNVDDCFRIGIQIQKKFVKLYTDFYSSDVIVASPLGLRTMLCSDKKSDYDFLSSIEVVIMDQADVFLMQNWQHIQLIFDKLHLQPQESHGCDFSRVRHWCLNGWSKFYRQTLMFSSFQSPEINALFSKSCWNYAGKVKITAAEFSGSVCQIALPVVQVFKRIECPCLPELPNRRFDLFVTEILPQLTTNIMNTMIFIPDYFDFVRLRNHFKKEEISFCEISEYTSHQNVSRARTLLYNKSRKFLLYTERFHFFNRIRIGGVGHVVFYQLPYYEEFYSDIINMMQSTTGKKVMVETEVNHSSSTSCMVMYSRFDAHRLERIVGTEYSKTLVGGLEQMHVFRSESLSTFSTRQCNS